MQKRGLGIICYDCSSAFSTVPCCIIEDELGRYELDSGLLAEGSTGPTTLVTTVVSSSESN